MKYFSGHSSSIPKERKIINTIIKSYVMQKNNSYNIINLFSSSAITILLALLSCERTTPQGRKSDVDARIEHKKNLTPTERRKMGESVQLHMNAELSSDRSQLSVRFSGKGDCSLHVWAAYSDKGKSAIVYSMDNSELYVDLNPLSRHSECFIIFPGHDGVYDTIMNYDIPKNYRNFTKIYVRCLIEPWTKQGEMLEPILVENIQ